MVDMKHTFANLAIGIVFLLLSACQPVDSTTIENEKSQIVQSTPSNLKSFKIGGIGFGTSSEIIKTKMGSPNQIIPEIMMCEDDIVCETWEYDNTSIYFYDGKLEGMDTKSTSMCLFDDVCPNQPIEDVYAHIGKTKIWPASSDKPALLQYLSITNEACWLWVFLNATKDTVQELRLACQP